MAKKVAQWGDTVPPRVLHPGFDQVTEQSVLQSGLERYVGEAVEYGFTPVYRSAWSAILERHSAGGNAAARAGVGFLLFGFIGAAVGAGSTASARVERIRIWVDFNGAVYVKTL